MTSRVGTSRLSRAATACALAVSAALACGDDEAFDGGEARDGGGSDAPTAEGDAGPVRAAFGLDARPLNATCKAPARPPEPSGVKLERVFANVKLPYLIWMAQIPGDGSRWFAAAIDGRIWSFPVNAPPDDPTLVMDLGTLAGMPVWVVSEGGLLGFTFDPKFAQTGRVYFTFTTDAGGTTATNTRSTVGRVRSTDNGVSFGQYETIIPPFHQPSLNHKGSQIAFGPDGKLYVGFGDGGPGRDENARGQSKSGFFSKILRLDVDTPPPPGQTYVIPPDNPFLGTDVEPATYARGFRQPFRMSFDRGSGQLWVGDVGEEKWEEIDVVAAGGNYGWPCREGSHDYAANDPVKCPRNVGLVDPLFEHEHVEGVSTLRAITGGVVYRGKAMPSLVGTYVYGDHETKEVFGLSYDPVTGAPKSRLLTTDTTTGVVAFTEDVDGEIYALELLPGAVYKLVPAAPEPANTFPDRLSKTGCVDPSDPKRPASAMIPYTVNAPFWSDGADKERAFAVPDGTTIGLTPSGHLDLPIGSVVTKTFSRGDRRIETRLLVRHVDGEWAGYSYAWNDAQTDAELLPSSARANVGGREWSFPSRSDCLRCHTAEAGRTLGFEVAQLNGDFVYTATNRIANQLATFDHVGLLTGGPGVVAPEALPRVVDPSLATAPIEPRARAYLHANCAQCHRGPGASRSDLDLRATTPLGAMNACNVAPKVDPFGIADARLLAPGDPVRSILSLRVHAPPGVRRMPPLGSNVVDDAGASLLDTWIASTPVCP